MARSHPNVDSLKAVLVEAWDELDQDYMRRTFTSVPRRLRACVRARRSNFEHLLH
jgi:hypothetical protein